MSLLSSSAVQDERQRNKEREGDYEYTSAANEEMPVEKILEAETAVEQKTELHSDGSSGTGSVSPISDLYWTESVFWEFVCVDDSVAATCSSRPQNLVRN